MTKQIQYRIGSGSYMFAETKKTLKKFAIEDLQIVESTLQRDSKYIYTGKNNNGLVITFWNTEI